MNVGGMKKFFNDCWDGKILRMIGGGAPVRRAGSADGKRKKEKPGRAYLENDWTDSDETEFIRTGQSRRFDWYVPFIFYSTFYGVVVVFEVSDPCAGSELRKDRGKKTPSSLISASGTPRWILLILDSFERGDPGGRFGRDEFWRRGWPIRNRKGFKLYKFKELGRAPESKRGKRSIVHSEGVNQKLKVRYQMKA